MKKPTKLKNGSGAYEIDFDCEEKRLMLDFSGNESFLGTPIQCYRNDSTVFLFVAHSYLYSFNAIEQCLDSAFITKNEKEAKHFVMPYYFLFRHYMELELKSLLMGITDTSPDLTHDIVELFDQFQYRVSALSFDKEKSGSADYAEFNSNKNNVQTLLLSLRKDIEEFKSIEPSNDFFRFLYNNEFELKEQKVSFDFNFQPVLFHRIVDTLRKVENHMWYLTGFNFLMG